MPIASIAHLSSAKVSVSGLAKVSFESFESIDHTSPLVKGLHYEATMVGKSSDSTIASEILSHLDENPILGRLKDDERLTHIRAKLQALA